MTTFETGIDCSARFSRCRHHSSQRMVASSHAVAGFLLLVAVALAGCGPMTLTRTRYVFEPHSPNEARQTKDGVSAEIKFVRQIPPSFIATVQRCDQYGRLLVDALGGPVNEQISLNRRGQYWEQVALTNNTDHVLRLNSLVVRLSDPAGNQIEPLTWGDLQADLMAVRPCPTSMRAFQQFRVNKVFDRNMEIIPGSTLSFWLAFSPPALEMPGVWKLAIYEVPVRVDPAGRPTRTTQFDMRVVARQITETIAKEHILDPGRVVERKDTSDSGVPVSGAAASAAAAPAAARLQSGERLVEAPRSSVEPTAQAGAIAPPSPGNVSQGAVRLTRDVIARAQSRLKDLGFDPGGADGSLGPKSRAAIRLFQTSRKLPVTGELTQQTLDALDVTP